MDIIVIGCGGIGSAACYWLSRLPGVRVTGIEQFALGHARGGSDDHSRIIRYAQHDPAYAALAGDAYETWAQVSDDAGHLPGQHLVTRTGGLVIEAVAERTDLSTGTRNVEGYARQLKEQGVDFEVLDADQVTARWPQFHLDGSERAVWQADTGLVDARRANATHLALARANGATILDQTPVESVRADGAGVAVVAGGRTYRADRAVVAGGAWTNRVLADVGVTLPLTVTQEQVTYYATPHRAEFAIGRFPVFMWHGRHNFYGFPVYGEVATKLGQHLGGHEVTADSRTFDADPTREERQRDFLAGHVPRFDGPVHYTKTCLYTIPPDQHFVVDQVPGTEQISVFVGAGHAFKFASLLGRTMADLAATGTTTTPIEPFGLDRPALTDPGYGRTFHV